MKNLIPDLTLRKPAYPSTLCRAHLIDLRRYGHKAKREPFIVQAGRCDKCKAPGRAYTVQESGGKDYVAPNPKGRTVRRAMQIAEEYGDGKLAEQDANRLVDFLCELYGNKFDLSDVYAGLPPQDVIKHTFKGVEAVVQMISEAAKSREQSEEQDDKEPSTPTESLNKLYLEIMKQGWTMQDLDEADFFSLLEILNKPAADTAYIDDVM